MECKYTVTTRKQECRWRPPPPGPRAGVLAVMDAWPGKIPLPTKCEAHSPYWPWNWGAS